MVLAPKLWGGISLRGGKWWVLTVGGGRVGRLAYNGCAGHEMVGQWWLVDDGTGCGW